jgi:hypothetical protein
MAATWAGASTESTMAIMMMTTMVTESIMAIMATTMTSR